MAAATTGKRSPPTDILHLCRAIADRSSVPTAEIEVATRVLTCVNLSFCLLVGKTKDELTGSPLHSVTPAGIHCSALLDRVIESSEPGSSVEKALGPGGPVTWAYSLWPVVGGDGRVLGVILQVAEATTAGRESVLVNQALLLGTLRQHELVEAAELLNSQLRMEMAARRAAESALVRSEKLAVAGRMAAVLAHEINNPLASVMDLLYLVQITSGVPLQALKYLDQADGELKRIAHIARQTLGFYRESTNPTSFSIRELLESIVDLLKARIRSADATVTLQCDSALIIKAMQGELRQVLSNLLLNSLDAPGVKRRVTIRAAAHTEPGTGRRRVRISVADNGCGIDAPLLPRLFEAFYTTKGTVGNGLGLWVCKQIIVNHGGVIQVRSRTNGARQGTTFSVHLPAEA